MRFQYLIILLFFLILFSLLIFTYNNSFKIINSIPKDTIQYQRKLSHYAKELNKLEIEMNHKILNGEKTILNCLKQSNITGDEKCFLGKGVEEEYMMKKP